MQSLGGVMVQIVPMMVTYLLGIILIVQSKVTLLQQVPHQLPPFHQHPLQTMSFLILPNSQAPPHHLHPLEISLLQILPHSRHQLQGAHFVANFITQEKKLMMELTLRLEVVLVCTAGTMVL